MRLKATTKTQARQQLGLTQEQMAQYLSVSQSLLARYETGQRELPLAALKKLADIEKFLYLPAAKKTTTRPHVKLQQAKVQQLMEQHAKQQEYKLEATQRKLNTAQKKYDQDMLLLGLADYLRAGSGAKNNKHNAWINMMEAIALGRVNQNGLHRQATLQLQISGIRQQQEQAMILKKVAFNR